MWELDRAEGHQGKVGVLLEDGTVPDPVYFDIGSGGHIPKSTDWWVYDGTLGAPLADRMRAACACGWYGEISYPIDWEQVQRHEPYQYDTSRPLEDWEKHTQQVADRAVPLPEDVAALLTQLRARVEDLEDSDILLGLRVVGELETITNCASPYLARTASAKYTEEELAQALGITEQVLMTRLRRYDRRYY